MLGLIVLFQIFQLLPHAVQAAEANDSVATNSSKPLYPVILVPGLIGSRLEAKLDREQVSHFYCQRQTSDWFDLWVGITDFLPFGVDCLEDNMKLIYNSTSRKTSNTPGVTIRAPKFGRCNAVDYLSSHRLPGTGYMNTMIQHLEGIGYERNKNLLAAPYDFRKAVNELGDWFDDLRKLVETAYTVNGNQSVVFISHSNGCQNLVYFLSKQTQAWKDKHVRSAIALAGVWGGVTKALLAYTHGVGFGPVVQPKVVRRLAGTFPSLASLLPSKEGFNSDDVLIKNGDKNYTVNDYKQLFADTSHPDGYDMWLDNNELVTPSPIPNVELHCLHSYDVPTMEQFQWNSGGFPDKMPKIVEGDGDGTVTFGSLQACQLYKKWQEKPFYYRTFAKVTHTAMVDEEIVFDYIREVLLDRVN